MITITKNETNRMNDKQSQHKTPILVKKASGDEELFSVEKLERSLQNAGADYEQIQKIIVDIENWIYNGASTKKIYSRAFSILRRNKTAAALRYKLKKAMLEFGPSGYPFENFIGQLFEAQGFQTEVGIVVDGKCITHEMDVIATKQNNQHLVECKYSKDQGKHVSVQVPLYVRSRVDDIVNKRKESDIFQGFLFTGWVITNTRFSGDSLRFGECSGLKLLAWDFPAGNGLKELIEKLKIYPLTILNSLTKTEKQFLINKEIVSCNQLQKSTGILNSMNLNEKKLKSILSELSHICNK